MANGSEGELSGSGGTSLIEAVNEALEEISDNRLFTCLIDLTDPSGSPIKPHEFQELIHCARRGRRPACLSGDREYWQRVRKEIRLLDDVYTILDSLMGNYQIPELDFFRPIAQLFATSWDYQPSKVESRSSKGRCSGDL